LPSGNVTSNEQKYSLNIEPPNPIFVEPQLQITRQAPADDPFNAEGLLPGEQPIEILVEFPDQHPRPLTRTTLYVDGAIADENTVEPFEQFTWDLSAYEVSGEHQLVVEAVDSFGLSNTSISIPVALTVIRPPAGVSAMLARYRAPITVAAIGLAGLALLAILLTGRLRMPSIRAAIEARRVEKDPVTQPVPATLTVPESITKDKPRRRTARRSAATSPPAIPASALLFPVQPADRQPIAAAPIPLSEDEILVGSDPAQCSLVFKDPSISGLHARLKRQDDGGYVLSDSGSVAGTWANFEPLPPEGHRLHVGDMVHFGRLAFRFSLPAEPEAAPPQIEVLKSDA
jgi:hypothetical protein